MPFYLATIVVAIFDHLIKLFFQSHFLPGQSVVLLPQVVKLTYVRNTGAAFSLFTGMSNYLAIVAILISCLVIYLHFRLPAKQLSCQLALGFILGGSLGNLIDRLGRGFVVDYIDFGWWPVFNLADIMINVGVALLLFYFIFGEGKDASRSV